MTSGTQRQMQDSIITYCIENRVSTTEVSDALGKVSPIASLQPNIVDHYSVGAIHCVFAADNSNYELHQSLDEVRPGDCVVVFTSNVHDRAVLGELVCKYLLLYKRVSALVVLGGIRDRAAILRSRYPVWFQFFSPQGTFNDEREPFPADLKREILDTFEGGVAVCDAGGVMLIPKSQVTKETLVKLKEIEQKEDLWFYCLDSLKWSTFQIVCEQKYLDEPELIPKHLRS